MLSREGTLGTLVRAPQWISYDRIIKQRNATRNSWRSSTRNFYRNDKKTLWGILDGTANQSQKKILRKLRQESWKEDLKKSQKELRDKCKKVEFREDLRKNSWGNHRRNSFRIPKIFLCLSEASQRESLKISFANSRKKIRRNSLRRSKKYFCRNSGMYF